MKFIKVVAVVAAIALISACGSDADKDDASGDSAGPQKVTLGAVSVTSPTLIIGLVAQELGIAAKHGIDIDFLKLTEPVMAQALASGKVDVLSAPAIETAILKGLDARMIAAANKPYWRLWGRDSVVDDWSDINGKRLGIPGSSGSSGDVLFRAALEQHGVDVKSVTFFYNSAAGNYGAFNAGSVDAAFTTAPYTYALEKADGVSEIDDMADTNGKSISTGYTMLNDRIDSDPDLAKNWVEMLLDTKDLLMTKPLDDRIVPAYSKYLTSAGVDPATLDLDRYLEQLATDGTWQVIPTHALVQQDLNYLTHVQDIADKAKSTDVDDIIYVVPGLESQY